MKPTQLILLALTLSLVAPLSAKEAIWIEGEDYATSTFNNHNWYENSDISKDLLSPGTPGISAGQSPSHDPS